MERKEGFIELNQILDLSDFSGSLADLHGALKNNPNVEIIHYEPFEPNKILCMFKYNGNVYYWKYDQYSLVYNELIIEEISRDLQIPCVNYDLAKIGNIKGVISKSYIIAGNKYISGSDLIHNRKDHHTLNDIKDALKVRYANNPQIEKIVDHIMNRLIQVYVLDILTAQTDRHPSNWGIVESADGSIDLQPIFDNERAHFMTFTPYLDIVNLQLHITSWSQYLEFAEKYGEFPHNLQPQLHANDTSTNFASEIESFWQYNNVKLNDLLSDRLWVISQENLKKVFERIENKTNYLMPDELKKDMLRNASIYYKFITKELEKNMIEKKKR